MCFSIRRRVRRFAGDPHTFRPECVTKMTAFWRQYTVDVQYHPHISLSGGNLALDREFSQQSEAMMVAGPLAAHSSITATQKSSPKCARNTQHMLHIQFWRHNDDAQRGALP